MNLRSYQQTAADYIRRKQRQGKFRVNLESPTGSGKTVILADLLRDPVRQLVISHRRVLLDQISKVLANAGISHGFRAAGHRPDPNAVIQLAMVQTEHRRFTKTGLANVDVVHVDEIHCQGGPNYREIFDAYHAAGASIVGYTASPSDLSGLVDENYLVVTTQQLIDGGYLCPPRVFCCGQPDLKLLEKLRRDAYGEYLAGDVDRLVKPHVIFGRVVEHYKRLNPDGRPFILFAHSVKASVWWAQSLSGMGIPTAHIDGDNIWVDGQFFGSDSAKRAECFKRIEQGGLQGLSNRFVLREGVDCPAVGHAILTCPFGARRTYVQACGRVLRPFVGRQFAIIQDHGGSSINHPALDSDTPWDWDSPPGLAEKIRKSNMQNEVEPEPIICPQCMAQRNVGAVCPFCGFTYRKHARYVIQSDGKLRLVVGRAFKPRSVTRRQGQDKVWERIYWKTVKRGHRTAEQAWAYYAYSNQWEWLPRNLPLMPKHEADWFIPLAKVPVNRLVGGHLLSQR